MPRPGSKRFTDVLRSASLAKSEWHEPSELAADVPPPPLTTRPNAQFDDVCVPVTAILELDDEPELTKSRVANLQAGCRTGRNRCGTISRISSLGRPEVRGAAGATKWQNAICRPPLDRLAFSERQLEPRLKLPCGCVRASCSGDECLA